MEPVHHKPCPGADCSSDHNLLVASLKMKFKKQLKAQIPRSHDLEALKSVRGTAYAVAVSDRFKALGL